MRVYNLQSRLATPAIAVLKKADDVASDRELDFGVYEDWFGCVPSKAMSKHNLINSQFWKDRIWENLTPEARKSSAYWCFDDDEEIQQLGPPDWFKDWNKIESIAGFYQQIKLICNATKRRAGPDFENSMKEELEQIIKEYPNYKECYDL